MPSTVQIYDYRYYTKIEGAEDIGINSVKSQKFICFDSFLLIDAMKRRGKQANGFEEWVKIARRTEFS